jgi:cysteine desulfurase/selenocysteine lyase
MISSSIKQDFPIFKNNPNLVYLDSAATSLKPQSVIDAVSDYYGNYSANVARGLYKIAEQATENYEGSREKTARFINASKSEEIVFTHGTTEAVNLVAYAWGRINVGRGDEIVTTVMEHHSNFVPWQELASENEAILKIIDIDEEGRLVFQNSFNKSSARTVNLSQIITKRTKLVAITHVSNVLGTVNPIKEIVRDVKRINPRCLILVDGAQAVPHMKVDVQDLGCDFYVFSGHKMLGPTGIGVLWGKYELLDDMVPFQFGGSMIEKVQLSETHFRKPPYKFEAGTPNIAGAIGMGNAIDYIEKVGFTAIQSLEQELVEYALKRLEEIKKVKVLGPLESESRSGVLSFGIETSNGSYVHPHDAGQIISDQGVCVRAGHHCAMPLHTRLGLPGSVRASLYMYNTKEDIDRLIDAIGKVKQLFA